MKLLSILRKLKRDSNASIFFAGESALDNLKRKKSNFFELVAQNIELTDVASYLGKHFSPRSIVEINGGLKINTDGLIAIIRSPQDNGQPNPFASLRTDANSAGLSILATYVAIGTSEEINQKIFEFHGAAKDLKEEKIKAIGRPVEALLANPSLMLLAILLAAKLNFKVDTNLVRAIRKCSRRVQFVRAEIIRRTLTTIMLSRKPSKFLRLMHSCGLLHEVLPELVACEGVKQLAQFHRFDVFDHCLTACDAAPKNLVLRWASLLHDIGKAVTKASGTKSGENKVTFYNHEVAGSRLATRILKRLGYDKLLIEEISELIYNHMYNYVDEKWSDTAVKRLIERAGISKEDLPNLGDLPLFQLRKADRVASGKVAKHRLSNAQIALEKRIKEEFKKKEMLTIKDLEIDGRTLMETFHLQEGPTIGNILKYLLEKTIKNIDLNVKDLLIDEASKYLSSALK